MNYKDWSASVLAFCLIGAAFFFYGTKDTTFLSGVFSGVSLRIEVANTDAQRELGLGGRASIPQYYGMLFVFPKPDTYGFWMKNMLVPVDIFWLDAQGGVISQQNNVSPASYPHVFYPEAPALYVLETRAGFAAAHDVKMGTLLELQKFPTVLQ